MRCSSQNAFPISLFYGKRVSNTGEQVSLLVTERPKEVILGKRLYVLGRGDALLALPFSYRRLKDEPLDFCGYEIQFSLDALRELMPELYFRCADGGGAIAFSRDAAERLLPLCASLLENTDALPYSAAQIFSILEQEALPETETELLRPLPKVLRRALAYLEENAMDHIEASFLADRYGVSESTLRRLFRTYFATTPCKYAKEIQKLRLGRYEKNEVV